ncbi:ABC transporter ATP-binding protein/permease [Escherichia coli]|uniref:ABC transporter ATP-binding protein/permease n=1 Tax=Escherichia coli TaxID=562 RepID=A0A376VYL9_ECOLX|nr:ABC transporter ATP-binding protein/permease [Escherichia coli]
MRVARIDARFDPTIYIAIGMANLLAIGGGSWMVVQGSLTLGQLTSFMMYLGLMIWPMLALAWMFNIVERGSAAYSRIVPCWPKRQSLLMVVIRCQKVVVNWM